MAGNKYILDHIENIYLNTNTFPITNIHALHYLRLGIIKIAHNVREEELRVFNLYPDIILSGAIENWDHLMNEFNWFSINLVNYVRLIGFIDIVNKEGYNRDDLAGNNKEVRSKIKEHCKKYLIITIPDIYNYRNKISAHHALSDPFYNDNIATLESSVLNSITYRKPYFKGAGISIHDNKENYTSDIEPWMLTKKFDNLVDRFFPGIQLPIFPESKKMTSMEIHEFITKEPWRKFHCVSLK